MKVLFVWFSMSDVTHDQTLAEWSGERHTSAVRKIPGLKKWIQNISAELPNATAVDGIGELWLDTAETMQHGRPRRKWRLQLKTVRGLPIWRGRTCWS